MTEEQGYRRPWGFREGRIQSVMTALDEHNEVKCGEAYIVRIPQIEGKISLRNAGPHLTYVDYISESWYDREKKQMRNRKVLIGQAMETFPGAMLPNKNYYDYFDRETGELKPLREREERRAENEEGIEQGETPEAECEENMTEKEKKMIQGVLEREGMIRREEEKIREAIRQEEEREENGEEEESKVPIETANRLYPDPRKKRVRILMDILTSMRDVIKDQAKKRPEAIVNSFQAQKINEVLKEIKEIEENKGYGEMLELITEPREEERNGETVICGMSYSDAEVLMEYYNSVIWFTQGEL